MFLKGVSWIPSNCYSNGDSLNGESLANVMLKIRQILGLCHKETKVGLPPQSMTMLSRHNNQPVFVIGFNIKT
jgi:hypothetical protein